MKTITILSSMDKYMINISKRLKPCTKQQTDHSLHPFKMVLYPLKMCLHPLKMVHLSSQMSLWMLTQ